MSGKAPAFQFYPGDWLRDTELHCASVATRGIWIDLLCRMFDSNDRGRLTGDVSTLARLAHCTDAEMKRFLEEAEVLHFCDVLRNRDGKITLTNRRMYREGLSRGNSRKRQQKYREKKGSNGEVTPPLFIFLFIFSF